MGGPPLLGILMALIAYSVSVSPSLLPRRWWWHGFVSGILVAAGYTLGWGIQVLGTYLLEVSGVVLIAPPTLINVVKWVVIAAVGIWTLRAAVVSFIDSQRAARLTQMRPVALPEYLLGLVASAAMFMLVMGLVWLFIQVFSLLAMLLEQWMPWIAATILSGLLALALFFLIWSRVVFRGIMAYFARAAQKLNSRSNNHLPIPQVAERSGSPLSHSSWESIGGQGRLFLGHGPDREQIEAVTGRPAIEPVRVYVGLPGGTPDLEALAEKAVQELRRAGGLERSVVVINIATGSGWVDEWLCQPLEYLTGGDCATVSMQYSYLFSAAMMLSDLTPCEQAGRALFQAVERAVLELPADRRPALIVAGESMGAYGSQAAFTDEQDLLARTSGAIWVGSPYQSPLLRALTAQRHRGSPEIAPVINSGRNIRFVGAPNQLEQDAYGRELSEWDFPRVVFAQHASDPVVWFSHSLALHEPDWLRERAGLDVSPSMRYTPLATYLQVIADLPVAGLASPGHGHTYHRELIDVWIKVLGLDSQSPLVSVESTDWVTPELKEAVAQAIEADHSHEGDHAQPKAVIAPGENDR